MDKVERWLPAGRSGFVLTWIWVSAMLTGLCSLEPFTSENATSLKWSVLASASTCRSGSTPRTRADFCHRSTARAILRRPRTPASGKSLAAAPQAGADGDCRSHVEPVVWPARLAVVAQLLRTSTAGHHCGVGWADQRSLIAGGLGLSCGWLAGQGPDLGRATGAARCARGARRGS
jgi:hypothetical protein